MKGGRGRNGSSPDHLPTGTTVTYTAQPKHFSPHGLEYQLYRIFDAAAGTGLIVTESSVWDTAGTESQWLSTRTSNPRDDLSGATPFPYCLKVTTTPTTINRYKR